MTAWKDPRVKPHVRAVAEMIRDRFGITNIGGYGLRDNVSDHPRGLALDVMTFKGEPIANWAVANAKALNVTYVIWNRRIWSVARAKEGWRRYIGPSPHTDHVHISFLAQPVTLQAGIGLGDVGGALKDGTKQIGGWLEDGADWLSGWTEDVPVIGSSGDVVTGTVEGTKAVLKGLEFFTNEHNWYRAGLFVLGGGLILIGVRSAAT